MDALTGLARVPHRPTRVDVGITVLLFGWALIEALAANSSGERWERVAFAFGVTAPLLYRRRAPLLALALLIAVLGVRVWAIEGWEDSTFPFPSLLVATFSAALHVAPLTVAVLAGLATLGAMLSLYPLGYYGSPVSVGQLLILGFFVAGAWTCGRLVRQRANQALRARSQAEEAAARERARIARELHDVVAHSLSIIAVQAGAAEELVLLQPQTAREHIAAARRTAREALTEMRHVLDVLRDEAPTLAPQPTLDRLPDLVDEVSAAGVRVELTTTGTRGTVSAGVDLAGYRIVQEALTNARRHASAARTSVAVDYQPGWIDLEIRNDGVRPDRTGDNGQGLVGMRERARLYGGTVHAAPDGDGFVVRARLPREQP
ncbi:histidine kinase [Dactylosporangium sp. AC04546]|uniref:sensor histidine kinase n=1 Tax=Dactylosporangium sp. AC04546 TaxID=2862460 RepID=UPI001EE152BA|nr:sensor histidine kinase [Dactylosporangium sp. AC04546]WVK84038.1 histidine kinase [Dactylosporangium sp. AC04546]